MDFNKLPRPVKPKLYELWKKYQDLAFLHALYDSDPTNRPHIASITEEYVWDITDWFNLYHSDPGDINHKPIPTESKPPSPPDFQKWQDQTKEVRPILSEQKGHVSRRAKRLNNSPTSQEAESLLVYKKGEPL